MANKSGWVQWIDGYSRWTNAYIANPSSASALNTFVQVIAALSGATFQKASYVLTDWPVTTPAAGDYNLDYYIAVRMQADTDHTKYREVQIFNPPESIMEEVPSRDGKYSKRLLQVHGEAVASAFSTMTGETFNYVTGWFCTKGEY
jgi:hypothetical protein